MYMKQNFDFYDLERNCHDGARYTIKVIEENNMEDELMEFLENYFCEKTPTFTEVNDLLWHEYDFIIEQLGINEDEEDEED